MKEAIIFLLAFLSFSGLCLAGSIILPFWEDQDGPIYSMILVLNTSPTENDLVNVMFYGYSGNQQSGDPIEKTIGPRHLEIFGTAHYPLFPRIKTGDNIGYAIVSETDGALIAIGIIYDADAKAGFVIPCFKGNDNLEADSGW